MSSACPAGPLLLATERPVAEHAGQHDEGRNEEEGDGETEDQDAHRHGHGDVDADLEVPMLHAEAPKRVSWLRRCLLML